MNSLFDARTEQFFNDLKQINSRLTTAQRQVSSGKRIEKASDDPDSITNLTHNQADLARLSQTKTNLQRVTTEVNTAEQALESAVSVFDQVRTLASQATSTTMTAQTREGLAGQIGSLMERMAGLANTQVDGRYIFSGDSDQSAAFTLDLTQSPPWSDYQGTPATRQVMDSVGTRITISKDASEIFTSSDASKHVFQSMEDLRQALLANDDAAIRTAINPLQGVSGHLNAMLASYGYVQNQLSEATNATVKTSLAISTEKAGIEDADITEAIVAMQTLKFNQEAALQTRGAMPTKSLFDYLG